MFRRARAGEGPRTLLNRSHRVTRLFRRQKTASMFSMNWPPPPSGRSKSRIPWKGTRGVDAVVEDWLDSRIVKPCLTADKTVPGRDPQTAPLPPGLPSQLAFALRGRGVTELYEHQAKAFIAARDPRTRALVVATPTASGKSYCFHLPVLSRMLEDRDARALYLYPTKALARDQEAGLREIMRASGLETGAVVYDGDTPGDARRAARERTGIVLTNPDMLHAGILPHHTAWARTFQNLKYVVVDELHTYKGVFGSHVANVLRRLMRVAKFHGSNPVLIGATATIGNPREHAARIFGIDPENQEELVAITENGAPQGERRVFMFNPPVVNAELGIRASYVKQAVMLATDLVRAHVPTIVFGQSRNNVEVMLRYLRDKVAPDVDASRIMGYRGGYLPEQRREIERKLRAGEVLCVVATNALELGIDIGSLDASGRVSYLGRTKDMLKVGGENVAAVEIESYLQTHPAVAIAQVVGVPDAKYDEVAAAFIECRPGATVTEAEVIEFCRGKISGFKVPRYVRTVERWPMSATKIQKYRLRDQLCNELGLRPPS